MTEEKSILVERAEAALSSLPLPEPDWDAFASRIEGAVSAAPAEDATLFDAPLPATDDDGEAPVTAPADDSVPAPGEIAAREAVAAAVAAEDSGPTLSVAPASSDEVDDAWSSAPETTEPAPPPGSWVDATAEASSGAVAAAEAEDLTAHASSEDSAPVASAEPAEPAESRREPVSLADLARASIARRGSAEKASIAKESLAVASQSRGQGDQIAQRVQAAASYATTASPSVAPPPPSARRADEARRGDVLKGPWPGIVIAAVGLAAGFALYLRRPESPAPLAIVQPAAEAPALPRAETAREPVADRKREPAAEPAGEAALDPDLPACPATGLHARRSEVRSNGGQGLGRGREGPCSARSALHGKHRQGSGGKESSSRKIARPRRRQHRAPRRVRPTASSDPPSFRAAP